MHFKKIVIIVSVFLVVAFGYYAVSPLFRSIKVMEPVPAGLENEVGDETREFPVVGTTGHPSSGKVRVLKTAAATVIRYEDFSTINGPDLHVYLAKDLDAKEFVDLGPIKGTEGNINYEVPDGVLVNEYQYVMYWCVPFGVLFNYAPIK